MLTVQAENSDGATCMETNECSSDIMEMVSILLKNKEIVFKSQQRNESELTDEEKSQIALDVLNKSPYAFLNRFGKYLPNSSLDYFDKFEDEDVKFFLQNMKKNLSKINTTKRNRRFEALKHLIEQNSYFSENEMMKRNPLLYEQLIGQYLSEEEKRSRNKPAEELNTLVQLLMEGIERDNARTKKKEQADAEDDAMEEEDDDCTSDDDEEQKPSTSRWGEFKEMEDERINRAEFYAKENITSIADGERNLLREEFVSIMHQSFLDGKDVDFDYNTVDDNEEYDNMDIVTHDEEEKYFDGDDDEHAGNGKQDADSSEDELDIYMNALNQNPTVTALSDNFEKL